MADLTAANRPVPVECPGLPGLLPTLWADWLFRPYGLTAEGIAAGAHRALKRARQ